MTDIPDRDPEYQARYDAVMVAHTVVDNYLPAKVVNRPTDIQTLVEVIHGLAGWIVYGEPDEMPEIKFDPERWECLNLDSARMWHKDGPCQCLRVKP